MKERVEREGRSAVADEEARDGLMERLKERAEGEERRREPISSNWREDGGRG